MTVRVDPDALTALAVELTATVGELGCITAGTQALVAHPAVAAAAVRAPIRVARAVGIMERALWAPGGLSWLAAGHGRLSAEVTAQVVAIRGAQVGAVTLDAVDVTAGLAVELGLRNADPLIALGRPALDAWIPEGPGVVTEVVAPAGAPLADGPSIGDLYGRLDTLAPGETEIAPVVGPDGVRRYVVLLRGLEPGVNPTVNTAAQAVKTSSGTRDAYTRAAERAIRLAGVPAGAELMLVGHSQGGIAAMNLAGELRGYRVTHVVAAGSPLANKRAAAGVRVLRIENRGDPVPQLDGAVEPERHGYCLYRFGRDVRASDIVAHHVLGTGYLPEIAAERFGTDPGVRSFADSAALYLRAAPGEPRRFRLDAGPYGQPDAVRVARAAARWW